MVNISKLTKINKKYHLIHFFHVSHYGTVQLCLLLPCCLTYNSPYSGAVINITAAQRKILENLQKCKRRTILGQRYTQYANAVETCGLESLANRRESHCCRSDKGACQFWTYWQFPPPPTRLNSHACNLRKVSNYSQMHIRTTRFKNTPSIPYISKQTLSQSSFKYFFIRCEPAKLLFQTFLFNNLS